MDNKAAHSVPQKTKGLVVKASPFNEVKLELGFVLILAVIVLLLAPHFSSSVSIQILILLGYGLLAMSWIVWRVKNVLSKLASQQETLVGQDEK